MTARRKPNIVHICGIPDGPYRYGGFRFEIHTYIGPALVNKRGDPVNKEPPKAFWKAWEAFSKLSQADKDLYAAK